MMGKRLCENDPSFKSHEDYYESIADEGQEEETEESESGYDAAVIENVTEYEENTVAAKLPKHWILQSVRLDPRSLGLGAARPGRASCHVQATHSMHQCQYMFIFLSGPDYS